MADAVDELSVFARLHQLGCGRRGEARLVHLFVDGPPLLCLVELELTARFLEILERRLERQRLLLPLDDDRCPAGLGVAPRVERDCTASGNPLERSRLASPPLLPPRLLLRVNLCGGLLLLVDEIVASRCHRRPAWLRLLTDTLEPLLAHFEIFVIHCLRLRPPLASVLLHSNDRAASYVLGMRPALDDLSPLRRVCLARACAVCQPGSLLSQRLDAVQF